MTEREQELQAVEAQIEGATEYLTFAESEKVLSKDKNFKTLILDGYFRDEPARLAGLLADPQMADEVNQREINSALKAVGHLRQYLMNVARTRNSIESTIDENRELADELRGEA